MTPHDKWTSADIARHTARAEADDVREFSGLPRKHSRAYYANLRNGDLYRGDDAPTPGLTVWVLALASIVIGAAIGAMTMPATPAPYVGPGFETCKGSC